MNKTYCLGEAMSDTFLELEESEITKKNGQKMICLPYGEKINVASLKHKSGGSAFNVAVGLKRFGLGASLIASVGKDSEGSRLTAAMDKEGIEHSNVIESDKFETKSAIILNGKDGDRTILVYHGQGVLNQEMVVWDKIEDGSWFYLGPMPDTGRELIDYLLEVVAKKNLKLVVNPGSVQVEWSKEDNLRIISKSELYVLNKEEAESIMGETGNEKALLSKFIKAGARKVIITDGRNGSMAYDGSNYYKQDIVKVKTADMTGAGDAYLAGVVGGLINGENLESAMKWGALNSASVVTKFGAQEGLLNMEEIKRKI
ncbi:carbohydrate kinase family protein [Patescibacteria group bacterium]|nr:carbohydrate kinase family protein [Patescibacteria group bacterium]